MLPQGVDWFDGFSSLKAGVHTASHVGLLILARPGKSNAFNGELWEQFPAAARKLGEHPDCRVVRPDRRASV